MNNPLRLVLTDHWFEEIKSGRKTHEYRVANAYWVSRITCNILAEKVKLQQQLAIAVEALEKYADKNNWILGYSSCDIVFDREDMGVSSSTEIAEQALQQIKEIK